MAKIDVYCSLLPSDNVIGWNTKMTQVGKLKNFGTRPNWAVSYITYTKFHLPRPVFHSTDSSTSFPDCDVKSEFKCKFYKQLQSPNLATIAKFDEIVKIGGCTQLFRQTPQTHSGANVNHSPFNHIYHTRMWHHDVPDRIRFECTYGNTAGYHYNIWCNVSLRSCFKIEEVVICHGSPLSSWIRMASGYDFPDSMKCHPVH